VGHSVGCDELLLLLLEALLLSEFGNVFNDVLLHNGHRCGLVLLAHAHLEEVVHLEALLDCDSLDLHEECMTEDLGNLLDYTLLEELESFSVAEECSTRIIAVDVDVENYATLPIVLLNCSIKRLLHRLVRNNQLDESLKCCVGSCPLRGEVGSVFGFIGCS